ncbi:MAG: hypothetical protein QOF78_2231, partial [Phycisphaerales bacterium]|nr:hypothetical protein [Phycisphaerales bacterium]
MVAQTESDVAESQAGEAAETARPPVSQRKRRANRRNAQKSTGPRTAEGKRRAARNSISHGIFCFDLLLDGED